MEMNELTRTTIGGAFTVGNLLGCGFLEKVYENALAVELRGRGLVVSQQHEFEVSYKGQIVGTYYADLLVQDRLVVEVKAVQAINPVHEAQCLNYLRASRLSLCLLINFARPRVELRRIAREFVAGT
jgi:GxxExxY protein